MARKAPVKKQYTQEAAGVVEGLPGKLRRLEELMQPIAARIEELAEAGLIYATEYWRPNAAGEPRFMYLLYPIVPGEPRRRDYVGANPDRIAAARAAIERANEYDQLMIRLGALNSCLSSVTAALSKATSLLDDPEPKRYW